MSLIKPNTWPVWRDIENYRDFVRIIKQEKKDPNSKFNKWKLNHNYFYTLYFTMDIDETEEQLPERIKRLRMVESLAPLHRYLDEELGFAECLTPEFNQFYDNKGNPTLTYLIAYRFVFNKLSFWWVVKKSLIIILIIFLFAKFNIIPFLIQWVQTLT